MGGSVIFTFRAGINSGIDCTPVFDKSMQISAIIIKKNMTVEHVFNVLDHALPDLLTEITH